MALHPEVPESRMLADLSGEFAADDSCGRRDQEPRRRHHQPLGVAAIVSIRRAGCTLET